MCQFDKYDELFLYPMTKWGSSLVCNQKFYSSRFDCQRLKIIIRKRGKLREEQWDIDRVPGYNGLFKGLLLNETLRFPC